MMAIAFALPSPSNEEIVSGGDFAEESYNPTDDKEVTLLSTHMLRRLMRLFMLG